MLTILKPIWGGMKWLGGATVAPLGTLRRSDRFGTILRCTAHGLAVVAVLLLLSWLNYWLELDRVLRTPLPFLRVIWLPLLAGVAYALVWIGWYVSRQLGAQDTSSAFPDIDAAWNQAMRSIRQTGIAPETTPLYLLVGRPSGRMHDLLRAGGIPLTLPPEPHDSAEPPLQVFANREAIYVSCSELSLLGQQAACFADAKRQSNMEGSPAAKGGDSESELVDGDVDLPDIRLAENHHESPLFAPSQPAIATATQDGLTLVEERIALLTEEASPTVAATELDAIAVERDLDPVPDDLSAALLTKSAQIELTTRRLQHLCELLVEERRPHVPLNGILLLVPAAATDADASANHVGRLAQEDLATIHATTEVRCPYLVLVCDLEQTPGATDLLSQFADEQRQRRLGVRLPEPVTGDKERTRQTIEEAVHWLCERLLPPLVYRLVLSPRGDDPLDERPLRANIGLYRFLYRMRQRQDRLTQLLHRTAADDGLAPGALAGCYLVATGQDSQREQGFAEAVFAMLPQLEHSLTWTEARLERDRQQQWFAKAGYFALLGVATTLLAWAFISI